MPITTSSNTTSKVSTTSTSAKSDVGGTGRSTGGNTGGTSRSGAAGMSAGAKTSAPSTTTSKSAPKSSTGSGQIGSKGGGASTQKPGAGTGNSVYKAGVVSPIRAQAAKTFNSVNRPSVGGTGKTSSAPSAPKPTISTGFIRSGAAGVNANKSSPPKSPASPQSKGIVTAGGKSYTNPKGVPDSVQKALAAKGYNPDGTKMQKPGIMANKYSQPIGPKKPTAPANKTTPKATGITPGPMTPNMPLRTPSPKVADGKVDLLNQALVGTPQHNVPMTSFGTGPATWPGQSAIPPNGPQFSAPPQHNVPQTAYGTGPATWPGQSAIPPNNPVKSSIVQANPAWPGQSAFPPNGPVFTPPAPQVAGPLPFRNGVRPTPDASAMGYSFPTFNPSMPAQQGAIDRGLSESITTGALSQPPNTPAAPAQEPVTGITYQGRGVGDAPTGADIAGVGNETVAPANASEGQSNYTVQRGDTLSKIAAKNGTTVQAIAAANGIKNPNAIKPGQQLTIPGANVQPMGGTVDPLDRVIEGMAADAEYTAPLDPVLTGPWNYFSGQTMDEYMGREEPGPWGPLNGEASSENPSQGENVPPSQLDRYPQDINELDNRWEYTKDNAKKGFRETPGRFANAIRNGDFYNTFGYGNFGDISGRNQNMLHPGTNSEVGGGGGSSGAVSNEVLLQQLLAVLQQQQGGLLSPQSQMDLVYKTFV